MGDGAQLLRNTHNLNDQKCLLMARFFEWEQQRSQLESESFAAERVELENEAVGSGRCKEREQGLDPHPLDLFEPEAGIAALQPGKLVVHLQTGKFQEVEGFVPDGNIGAADDHGHLVGLAAGSADFETSVKMTYPEYVLAIVENSHGTWAGLML